jgi:hypothetical protein
VRSWLVIIVLYAGCSRETRGLDLDGSTPDAQRSVAEICGVDANHHVFDCDAGGCMIRSSNRTCAPDVPCALDDGTGFCVCQPKQGPNQGVCSLCVFDFLASGDAAGCLRSEPYSCTADTDCPSGVCVFDPGCDQHAGHCSATRCSYPAKTFCGCDGVAFEASCPGKAWSHVGACP